MLTAEEANTSAEAPLDVDKWIRLVQAEYRESPGLRLTKRQVRRFWNLDDETCDAVLDELESSRFLRRVPGERYVRTGVM
jgi:hypothetical protein